MQSANPAGWSVQDSAALYGISRWGEPYFSVNTRGHISVQDRPGLEKRTCECYEVVKKEYDRLLPATVAV